MDNSNLNYDSQAPLSPRYSLPRSLSRADQSAQASGYQLSLQHANLPESYISEQTRKSKEILDNLSQFNPKVNNNRQDIRPLRDANYQLKIMRHILLFKERKGLAPDVSSDSFKLKETAAFKKLFQALYSLFDPAHIFAGNLKEEFPELLRRLGTLPKNLVQVVGSLGNWEHAIGLLDWMVCLFEIEEKIDQSEKNATLIDFKDETVNFYKMQLLEEFSQSLTSDSVNFEAELQEIFFDRTKQYTEEIEGAKKTIAELETELQLIEKTKESYASVEQKHAHFLDVLKSSQDSLDRFKLKYAERQARLAEAQDFIKTEDHALQIASQEYHSLKAEAEALPYTWDTLEDMQQEKNQYKEIIKIKEKQLQLLQAAEKDSLRNLQEADCLLAKAITEFNSTLAKLDLGASYSNIEFVIPSDMQGATKFLETHYETIKGAIFESKGKTSSEKHMLSQQRSQLESQMANIKETIEVLKGLCYETEQEINQLEFNYDKLKRENTQTMEGMNSNLTTLKATLLETESRYKAESIAIQEQIKLLESNQTQIEQLAAERLQKAASQLESIISFALHLKNQTTKCIAEVKIQIDETAANTEIKLASLCETEANQ